MKFTLERLKINNFKGIKEQEINFDEFETTICGENGTGKTTVVDAFSWLLFEKDSKGRAQFEIKTLENGEQLHGLEHTVEGHFKIDGRPLKLKKTYKEVWTKKRGEEQATFTGHEIERVINDIPVKKSEYEKKIGQLVDEKIFQLITDPMYFSQQLNWKDRRATLFSLTGGDINNEDVFLANPSLRAIEGDLEDKTIEELKKSLSYQRGELNKQRENIPVKIETLNGTIKLVDKDVIEFRCKSIRSGIAELEKQMTDASELGKDLLKKQDELYKLRTRQKEIEHDIQSNLKDPGEGIKKEIKDLEQKIKEKQYEADSESKQIAMIEKNIARIKPTLEKLREEYSEEAARTLVVNEDLKACPTCHREFPEEEVASRISELEENFKAKQVENLKNLRNRGQEMAAELEDLEEQHKQSLENLNNFKEIETNYRDEIKQKETMLENLSVPDLQSILEENDEYKKNIESIRMLEEEFQKPSDHNSKINDLKQKKSELEKELIEKERELKQEEINQETRNKISALMEEEKVLSNQINRIEQKENIADQFINTKAEIIERSVNEKFEKVSFRLFKKQINGALDETCDALVDGVPFDNANTAGQVNAGLDIINSLCRHYEVYAPIFIDNRESVNELIHTDSQLINLKVTKHKTLRVETEN